MTTEEKIKVMQAHIDGEYIEFRIKGEKLWEDCGIPAWNWQEFEYRIKPEPKKPTYRPYKDTKEMIADYKERFKVDVPPYAMPLICITSKHSDSTIIINRFNVISVESGMWTLMMDDLYLDYTYLDGSPCGKLVEE